MSAKAKKIIMVLIGAYLIYTGVDLIRSVLRNDPKNMTGYIIAGAFFAILGAVTIVINIREYIEENKREAKEMSGDDTGNEETGDKKIENDDETDSDDMLEAGEEIDSAEDIESEIEIDPDDALELEEEEGQRSRDIERN